MILIDCACPKCRGRGYVKNKACENCRGTGSVGGTIDMPGYQLPTPTPFGIKLREWRLAMGYTFRLLSQNVGIKPGVLSEIENGRREPTEEERARLEEFMR